MKKEICVVTFYGAKKNRYSRNGKQMKAKKKASIEIH